ncbi:hypothetical protein PFISCL1PPCAC_13733, partial [Pristionchus fissidentatus]
LRILPLHFSLHSHPFPSLRMVGSTSFSPSATSPAPIRYPPGDSNQRSIGVSPDEDEPSVTPPAEFVRENDKGQLVNDYGEPWPRPRPKKKKTQAKPAEKKDKKKKKSESTESSRKSSRKSKRRSKKDKKKEEKSSDTDTVTQRCGSKCFQKRRRSRKAKLKEAEYITLSVDSEQENSDRSVRAKCERKQMDVQTSPQASRKSTE